MTAKQKKAMLYSALAVLGIILVILLRSRASATVQILGDEDGGAPISPYSIALDLPSPAAGGVYNIYGGDGGSFVLNGSRITIPNSYLGQRSGNPVPIYQVGNGSSRIPSIANNDCGCNSCGGGLGAVYANPISAGNTISGSIALNTGPMTSTGR